MQIDIRDLQEALRFCEEATGRPMAVSLNRAGRTVVIGAKGVKGAMQLTPKADKAKIQNLSDRILGGYVAKKLRAAGVKITAALMAEGVRKERARRLSAVGYTAFAGWSNAAKAFGGTGVRGVTGSQKKLARFGYGSKATPQDLVAELVNTAPAAEEIGFDALQEAVGNAADDLVTYGVNKLQKEVFDRVNAK